MLYCQYGEQRGIGATAHLARVGGKNIAIDHGIGLENNGEFNLQYAPSGNFFEGERIDLIIVTHSHFDHIGAIPALMTEHPEATVFISMPAFESGYVILRDSLNIARRNVRAAESAGREIPDIVFDDKDFKEFALSGRMEVIETDGKDEFPCWLEPWPGWQIGFASAGHHVGALMTFIVPPNDRPVLVTGDVSAHDQEIVKGAMLPVESFLDGFLQLPGLVMITEATNGARRMAKTRETLKAELKQLMLRLQSQGGIPLFPVFAQNRAANVVKMLVEMGFKPWVDGLARRLLRTELPEAEQWLKEERIFFFDETDWEIAAAQRRAVAEGEYGFAPIVAPSASLDKGYAVEHAERILPGTNNALVFTGHMFEGSVAKQILNIDKGRTIKLNKFRSEPAYVNVRCEVHHFDFTSHDYQEALVERVRLARPEHLIVHHCDDAGFAGLSSALMETAPRPVTIRRGSHMREILI